MERGDKLRAYYQIKYLSQFHEIYLFAASEEEIKDSWIEELKPYCKNIFTSKISLTDKAIGIGHALVKKWPLQTGICYKKSFHQVFKKSLIQFKIDAVYCQLIRMVPYCEDVALPKILDFMDAFGEGMKRRANLVSFLESKIYNFESNRVLKYENACYKLFDLGTIISENDKKALGLNNSDNIVVISNGIDTNKFHPSKNNIKSYDVGLIGNMGYLPNIEAAEYLVNIIAKEYKSRYDCDLRILIAGARPDARVLALKNDNVKVLGWLENIVDAYHNISVMCAPIQSGTGQLNKILESMACGVPVVCLEHLNQSIKAINGETIITTNLESMAEVIHNLLHNKDLYKAIAINSQSFVTNKYAWTSATEPLNQCFSNIIEK